MKENLLLLEELKSIYKINKDQLLFAESKNGIALVFNMSILSAFLEKCYTGLFIDKIVIIGVLLSSIIAFLSLSPFSYDSGKNKKIDSWNDSIIYFRNIAAYDVEDYIIELCSQLQIIYDPLKVFRLSIAYAQEIIVISEIVVLKNKAFKWAMLSSALSVIVIAVSFIVE